MRPAARSKRPPPHTIKSIDTLLHEAGLERSVRRSSPRINHLLRPERLISAAREELFRPARAPRAAANGVCWLPVPGWGRFPWLWHGFSTRKGGLSRAYCSEDVPGELNLGFTAADRRETVLRNRRLLAEAVSGDPSTPLVTVRQIHSNRVVRARVPRSAQESPLKADGLFTDEPGLLIAVLTADCIPVLVADRKRHVVAAFHAGWRGTLKRIVETGVGRMRLEFGSRPEDLVAAIGPGIGACCYAVGEEVCSQFESQFDYAHTLFREVFSSDPVRIKYPMLFLNQRAPGHSAPHSSLHLDLVEANRRQLRAAGVDADAIKVVGGCTCCQADLFFSHRASGGNTGRLMAVIGMRRPSRT